MKKNIYFAIIILILIGCNKSEYEKEIEAINDVLETVILKERPSYPYFDDSSAIPFNFKHETTTKKEELIRLNQYVDSRPFVVYITPTLLSLKDTLLKRKWLYKNKKFESVYKKLINSKNFNTLESVDFNPYKLSNTWKYKILASPLAEEDVIKCNYLKLNISRVCFNTDHTLGFFYIEVLKFGYGYVSLILIKKSEIRNGKWELLDGTYYH